MEENKIVAELEVLVDEQKHVFKRSLYKNGKNEIDGEEAKNISTYNEKINKIVFNNFNNKPTFRQLITKFIRLENSNENSLLKYLGNYCKNFEYQAIYSYLFGLDNSKSQNVDIISLNQSIDKDIEAIFRKNGVASLNEFKAKISLMKDEVDKFKKAYSEVTIIDSYKDKMKEIEDLLTKINILEGEVARKNLKVDLMKEKINKESKKIFQVDHKLLKRIYEETKLNVSKQLKDFKELENFHNGMVNKRINILNDSLNELKLSLKSSQENLFKLRKEYETNYISFNSELKDKFEEKYEEFSLNKIKLQNYINDYDYILKKQHEKEENLERKVSESNDSNKREKVEFTLNKYFKEYTKDVIGETFAIVLNEGENEFPVKIIGMNGKPGTGIKKAMITCFDLAHISLIIEKNYHMPIFEIHDKLENIDLNELRKIIDISRTFKGQYIFPILNDRIGTLKIEENEIVLTLSSNDKFFRI